MACAHTSLTVESYEEATLGATSGSDIDGGPAQKRRKRRHSSYHIRRTSSGHWDDDTILLKVDLFLSELGRRLDFQESLGSFNLDAGVSRAYSTLHAVRESCSQASDELIGAGRRRAKVLVETLESRYNEVLATRDTLDQKVHVGIKMMEDLLIDFEVKAQSMRDTSFGSMAEGLVGQGKRRVDEGLGKAREVVDEGIDRARRAKYQLRESVESAIQRAREHGLIKYEDLPHPWRVNPHIIKGYRFSETKIDCIRSVVSISNELVNIWSHAIGLIIVLAIAFYFYPMSVNFSLSTKTDIFIAAVFFFAACKCLVCSTMWHTMNSIAEQTLMERFACVDYTGISLLIAASIMTIEYTAFYCEPVSQWSYIIMTGALGIGGVILPWYPTFNRADMSWARVAFYCMLGATGLLPVFQLNITRGPEWSYYFYAPIMKSVAIYLCGAIVYASQIPERWWPGGFDYIGGSHNLWHLAVLGGILFHYHAMQEIFAGAFQRAQLECSRTTGWNSA